MALPTSVSTFLSGTTSSARSSLVLNCPSPVGFEAYGYSSASVIGVWSEYAGL